MRQGSGNNSDSARKREPVVHSINPTAVAQIGTALGNKATDVPGTLRGGAEAMHKGRGFSAPHDEGRTIHHGGSQRRHD
jgi:hypothetical protein